jgi:hypothetical protein
MLFSSRHSTAFAFTVGRFFIFANEIFTKNSHLTAAKLKVDTKLVNLDQQHLLTHF